MTTLSRRTYSIIVIFGIMFLLLTAGQGFGVTLEEAKTKGWVGERPDGYLGIVTPSLPSEAKKLMKDVNGKRRALYQKIASKNRTNLSAVETLAGEKAVKHTKPGNFTLLPSGQWAPKP